MEAKNSFQVVHNSIGRYMNYKTRSYNGKLNVQIIRELRAHNQSSCVCVRNYEEAVEEWSCHSLGVTFLYNSSDCSFSNSVKVSRLCIGTKEAKGTWFKAKYLFTFYTWVILGITSIPEIDQIVYFSLLLFLICTYLIGFLWWLIKLIKLLLYKEDVEKMDNDVCSKMLVSMVC